MEVRAQWNGEAWRKYFDPTAPKWLLKWKVLLGNDSVRESALIGVVLKILWLKIRSLECKGNILWLSRHLQWSGFWLGFVPYGVSSARDHHSKSIRMTSRSCQACLPPLPSGDLCIHITLKGIHSCRVDGNLIGRNTSPSRGNRWSKM